MKSIKPDNSISSQLSTIRLKDSIADFSKFEIKIYGLNSFHKIARFDDEEPHQRKRPVYSGIKEAIYKKLENGSNQTN